MPIGDQYPTSTIVRIAGGTFRSLRSRSSSEREGDAPPKPGSVLRHMIARIRRFAAVRGPQLAVTVAPVMALALFLAEGRRWVS